MVRLLEVRVPASSANLGPGFDCLGLALSIYNNFTFEHASRVEIKVTGAGAGVIPQDETNLVFRGLQVAANHLDQRISGVRISIHSEIPPNSGLGSSATAAVAGVVGGFYLLGAEPTEQEVIDLAASLEGHPDNVVPAVTGGLAVTRMDGKHIHYVPFNPNIRGDVLLVIPKIRVETKRARSVLPQTVSFPDACANIGNACLLLSGVISGNVEILKYAAADRLHQAYRAQLIPGVLTALEKASEAGAYFAALSGSGPTVIAFCHSDRTERIKSSIVDAFKQNGLSAQALMVDVDRAGAIAASLGV